MGKTSVSEIEDRLGILALTCRQLTWALKFIRNEWGRPMRSSLNLMFNVSSLERMQHQEPHTAAAQ